MVFFSIFAKLNLFVDFNTLTPFYFMKNSTSLSQISKRNYSKPKLKVLGQVKKLTLDMGSSSSDMTGLMGMVM